MTKTIPYLFLLLILLISFSCQEVILGPDEENTPQNNFDLMWQDFDLHYALFEVRQRNWDSIYTVFDARIDDSMSDEDLFESLKEMINYLDDTHCYIYNPYTKEYYESGSALNLEAIDLFSLDLLQEKYVDGYTNLSENVEFAYGQIKDKDIGYIYINGMGGIEPDQIDVILDEIRDHAAIILDLRLNGGGSDLFSARVAGAFADKDTLIYTVQNRNGVEHDDFDDKLEYYTEAIGEVYTKPVVVLTDRFTVSAAEIFLLHMNAFDHVTQIGDYTSGDFSDVGNGRFLPNGWYYAYSIQKFLLPDGSSLDGIGHKPDIYIKNTLDNMANKEDKVIERAFQFLFEEYGIK